MASVIVAFTAAISNADIQIAFVASALAKAKRIRIMSDLRLIDKEERRLAPSVGNVGVRRDNKRRDVVYDRLVSDWRCGVGDKESAVDRIVRIEHQSVQPWFGREVDFSGDIEKRYRIHRSGWEVDDLDLPPLFHHEKPGRIPGRSSDAKRKGEAARGPCRVEGVASARR